MQQIIVYRNPLEAAMWDSIMNGNPVVILFFLSTAVSVVLAAMASEWIFRNVVIRLTPSRLLGAGSRITDVYDWFGDRFVYVMMALAVVANVYFWFWLV